MSVDAGRRRAPARGSVRLDMPVTYLKGVGERRAALLRRLGIVTAGDLLTHVPHRYEDASTVSPIAALSVGMDATIVGTVISKGVLPTRRGLRIFQVVLRDDSGMIEVSWPGQPFLDRVIEKQDVLLVTGTIRFFHGRQLQAREYVNLGADAVGLEQGKEGTLVHDDDRDLGIELPHASHLAVLAGDQPLVGRREFDEETPVGQPEVGPEAGHRRALLVPTQSEFHRLVLPTLLVEIENGGEHTLRGMGESNLARRAARRMMGAPRGPARTSLPAHSPEARDTDS